MSRRKPIAFTKAEKAMALSRSMGQVVTTKEFCKWLNIIEEHVPHYNRNQKKLTRLQVMAVSDYLGYPIVLYNNGAAGMG